MKAAELAQHVLASMAVLKDQAQDWLLDKALGWPEQPLVNKIDTHHHMVPAFYAEAIEQNGGDPTGWSTPGWSPTASKLLMNRMGIKSAILSVTAPGACVVEDPLKQQNLARRLNEYAAALRDEDPYSFGFFASLPDIRNTSAALAEIRYAFDDLGADGVTLFTRYGPGPMYLGHRDFEPVWAELNRREAVVFVHPSHPIDDSLVNAKLLPPVIDFPHETTRSAMDMIMSRTLLKYSETKVILSHAGGALPYLITRMSLPLSKFPDMAARWKVGVDYQDAMRSFRKFYYDVALSSAPQVLSTLLSMVPQDHILYGSDFPYAPAPAYPAFLEALEAADIPKEARDQLNFMNAEKLIPRLAKEVCIV
ncbi:amidohydrolase 2 [Xylariaceae sp. FL1272]|nr:amidohydrolase 2 [Xylariaceae sp. FL1272]